MLSDNLQSSSSSHQTPVESAGAVAQDAPGSTHPASPFAFNNPQRASIGVPLEFPSVCPAINTITLHPRIIVACRQLLGHDPSDISSLRLLQSQLLTRTGPPLAANSTSNDLFTNTYGQRIHPDYPNNTLLVPPAFNTAPEAVQVLLYLSDVHDVGGTTAVVPCEGLDDEAYFSSTDPLAGQLGNPPHIWTNDRRLTEKLCSESDPQRAAFRKRL